MRIVRTQLPSLIATPLVVMLPLMLAAACGADADSSPESAMGGTLGVIAESTGGAGGTADSITAPSPQSGGATSSGGMGNGGRPQNTGGVAAGGTPQSTGGVAAGGTPQSTGGVAAGGSPESTGGAANGGSPESMGGAANGGSPESTGGVASGGSPENMAEPMDVKELLKAANPGNEKLANYVDKEIGDPVIVMTGTGKDRKIDRTIVVPPGAVYDGMGEKLTPSGLGGGSQDEGQKPLFILAPGASIKNVTIGKPGVEGIHMMGDNTLENIVWEDVGEDAASVRSYFPGGKIVISGGSARNAADKVFQINAPCDVTVKNFKATNIGKLIRQNGGEDFPLTITLDNVTANNVKAAVVMSDSRQCKVRYRNVKTNGKLFEGPIKKEKF